MLGELNGIMTSKSRLFRRGEQLVRDIKKAFNFGGGESWILGVLVYTSTLLHT